jgi:uncharacterized protein GlcG (DUF336 family)
MLKLAEANRAIVAAQAYARDHGYSISVTICDSMGHLIADERMDDALLLSGYGSVGKAIASAGLGIPSGEESDVDLERSPVSGVLAHGLAVIRRPGGLPISVEEAWQAPLESVVRRRMNKTKNARAAVSRLSICERSNRRSRRGKQRQNSTAHFLNADGLFH